VLAVKKKLHASNPIPSQNQVSRSARLKKFSNDPKARLRTSPTRFMAFDVLLLPNVAKLQQQLQEAD